MKRNSPSPSGPAISPCGLRNRSRTFTGAKHLLLTVTLLTISPAFAKERTADRGLPVVYNLVSAETADLDRRARKVYAGKFRIIEVTEREGFVQGRMKARQNDFADLRTPRGHRTSGNVVYLFVVTADGRVIEPRLLQSSDRHVSDSLIDTLLAIRFVPARFGGAPVASLHSIEVKLEIEEPGRNQPANNGLGLPGYRDR